MNITKPKIFIPAVFILLSLYYTFPFLTKLNYLGVRDWDLFTTIAAVPVGSLLEYGQFPFWNPYLGGGNILFHHPEIAVLSPFILLYLLFGAVVGLKLQVLICYFLGFWGSFKFMEKLGISSAASFMGAVVYFGSVHFALHFAEGHMPFTHFCFLPWFLFFLFKSFEKTRYFILAALSLSLMIMGNGGAVPLLYSLTFSGLLFGLLSVSRNDFIYIRNFAFSVIAALGISAVKFLPMVIYLSQNNWSGNPDEMIPLSALPHIFFSLNHSIFANNFSGQFWNWHEYGAYISPLIILFAAWALVKNFRKHFIWLGLFLFFLILGLGDFGSFSLWALLSQLPGFASARCTGRAFQMVILCAAILGGFGYDLIANKLSVSKTKILKYFPVIIITLVVGTNVVLAFPIMNSAFKTRLIESYRNYEFKHVVDQKPQAYKNYLANRGSLVAPWLSAYHPSRGLVGSFKNVAEEYIKEGKAEIVSRKYTPNRIEYEIIGLKPGEIIFGMGYDPGWYSENGIEIFETNGLITLPFEKGKARIVLIYRTPYFFMGLVISLVSIIIVGFIWRKQT